MATSYSKYSKQVLIYLHIYSFVSYVEILTLKEFLYIASWRKKKTLAVLLKSNCYSVTSSATSQLTVQSSANVRQGKKELDLTPAVL